MSDHAVADLLAKNFIARRDVKAVQHKDGSWAPHREYNPASGKHDGQYIPWGRTDLNTHLDRTNTFGHYLLDTNANVKLFAFDIDLEQYNPKNPECKFYYPSGWGKDPLDEPGPSYNPIEFDPRTDWQNRAHPSREWLKYQLKTAAHELLAVIDKELQLPCAAAYSGGKGVHVYAFTGLLPAGEAIEGANIVLDILGKYEASRGNNFFKDTNQDHMQGLQNLCIEVFPKQTSIAEDGLGNLMRLPLGRNLKSNDPTFFLDMTAPLGVMAPVDPIHALKGNPWKMVGE